MSYAAVVAASCGASLNSLDGESLIAHLGRMGRSEAGGGAGGGGGGGRVGVQGEGEQKSLDEMMGRMLEDIGARDAARDGGVYMHIYMHMYVYIYICMNIYIYIYIYIYI
jgi:hypothetical protein